MKYFRQTFFCYITATYNYTVYFFEVSCLQHALALQGAPHAPRAAPPPALTQGVEAGMGGTRPRLLLRESAACPCELLGVWARERLGVWAVALWSILMTPRTWSVL